VGHTGEKDEAAVRRNDAMKGVKGFVGLVVGDVVGMTARGSDDEVIGMRNGDGAIGEDETRGETMGAVEVACDEGEEAEVGADDGVNEEDGRSEE